jgi:hypothetical protein
LEYNPYFGVSMEKTSKMLENAAHGAEETVETMAQIMLSVMDKLAGKESEIKLKFEDLTLEAGMMKAKVNGGIVLSVVYSKDAEATTTIRLSKNKVAGQKME